jgi:hypothetical protein
LAVRTLTSCNKSGAGLYAISLLKVSLMSMPSRVKLFDWVRFPFKLAVSVQKVLRSMLVVQEAPTVDTEPGT